MKMKILINVWALSMFVTSCNTKPAIVPTPDVDMSYNKTVEVQASPTNKVVKLEQTHVPTPIPTPTPTPILPSLLALNEMVEQNDFHFAADLDNSLSPDGQWVVLKEMLNNPPKINIIPLQKPNKPISIEFNEIRDDESSPQLGAWAPDNTAIVVRRSAKGKCRENKVSIVNIQENQNSWVGSFLIPPGFEDCLGIVWSPDSTRLAVIYGNNVAVLDRSARIIGRFYGTSRCQGTIWFPDASALAVVYESQVIMLNRDGKMKNKIKIQDTDFHISNISWVKNGLLVLVLQSNHSEYSELRLYNLDNQDKYTILYKSEMETFLGGVDIEKGNILLGSRFDDQGEISSKLILIDSTSGQILKNYILKGRLTFNYYFIVNPPGYIGYTIELKNTQSNTSSINSYFFDLTTQQLIACPDCSFAIGWRPNMNGFLVLKNNKEKNTYWIEIIKP